MNQRPGSAHARARSRRIGAAVAVAAALAFVVWVVAARNDDGNNSSSTATTGATGETSVHQNVVVAATVANLRALASVTDHPIYWAGPRTGVTYELTQTPDGRMFVRYLPRGVAVGDRNAHLLVATYPVDDAYAAVEKAGAESGAVTFKIARGGLAVYNGNAATNVYFAYPDTQYQVEVFDPDAATARNLVASGAIRPIR